MCIEYINVYSLASADEEF